MINAIVVTKGALGSNLLKQYKFDQMFYYEDFYKAKDMLFNELLFAGLPDCKERANKYSQEDDDIIKNMKDILRTIKVNRIIVISTIDVYNDTDRELDEDYDCDWFINHPYGNHRYMFEYFIKNRFENHHIIRLPHIFTHSTKLHLISELTNNNFEKPLIHRNYQFYCLDWLISDINVVIKNNIKLCNFSTEPIELTELMNILKISHENFDTYEKGRFYYIITKHSKIFNSSKKNYIRNKDEVINLIENFI